MPEQLRFATQMFVFAHRAPHANFKMDGAQRDPIRWARIVRNTWLEFPGNLISAMMRVTKGARTPRRCIEFATRLVRMGVSLFFGLLPFRPQNLIYFLPSFRLLESLIGVVISISFRPRRLLLRSDAILTIHTHFYSLSLYRRVCFYCGFLPHSSALKTHNISIKFLSELFTSF